MVYIVSNPQSTRCSLKNHTMKQQQQKIQGGEIELVQAKNAVEESDIGEYAQSIIAACTCTHTSNIRIKMASARFYYTGCMSMMSLYHYGIKDIGWYVSFIPLVIIEIQVSF